MPHVPTGVVACVAACLLLGACGGGSTASDDESPPEPTKTASDGFEAPGGKVVFDLDVSHQEKHPAVEAYAAWQRAATESLRSRELADAVRAGAAGSPVATVERSLATVRESDYTVPRRMVGRVESVRSTPRAAILTTCLWSPSFDYRDRSTGERVADRGPYWMGVEVRMTRKSGQNGRWIVAALSTREDCEGSRP